MINYILNCTVYYYTSTDGCFVLFSSETNSNNFDELTSILDTITGEEISNKEFEPESSCLKYSAVIGYIDSEGKFQTIKEKYTTLDIKNFCKDFWNVASKLSIFTK